MPIGVTPGRGSKPTDWKSIVAVRDVLHRS